MVQCLAGRWNTVNGLKHFPNLRWWCCALKGHCVVTTRAYTINKNKCAGLMLRSLWRCSSPPRFTSIFRWLNLIWTNPPTTTPRLFSHLSSMVDFLLFPLLVLFSPSFFPSVLYPTPLPLQLLLCSNPSLTYNLVFFGWLISYSNKHRGLQDTSRKLLSVITAESGLHAICRGPLYS